VIDAILGIFGDVTGISSSLLNLIPIQTRVSIDGIIDPQGTEDVGCVWWNYLMNNNFCCSFTIPSLP
jgi:hypothetical protein